MHSAMINYVLNYFYMAKYRFFELKDKEIGEDYLRADYLSDAKYFFRKIYPNHAGVVKEVFMSQFNRDSKNFIVDNSDLK